ncbi:histone-like nucleoid-structuring protein Lsr2 [Kitasatospora sp. NPDC091335]|uniref:Lsr2 family DNA-binding protein n=1 Tax=Kitasatospora sp. NPDC091335 TaxID=3364085 RepID=UPI003801C906
MADRLEGVSSGDWTGSAARRRDPRPQDEPVRRWARANGFGVSERGRVPSALREACEASL